MESLAEITLKLWNRIAKEEKIDRKIEKAMILYSILISHIDYFFLFFMLFTH